MTGTLTSAAPVSAASTRWMPWLVWGLILVAALLRFHHITDPPLDFHATRQYRSANIARYLYLQTEDATQPEQLEQAKLNAEQYMEPPIMEKLAVLLYRLTGGENLALPRAMASLFWVLGGWFLFLLGLRLFSPGFSLFATAIYLFLPFGVTASRVFQPDPLMVCCLIASLYLIMKHHEDPTRRRLIQAALMSGFAVFVKPVSVFFVVGVFFALFLLRRRMAPPDAATPRGVRALLSLALYGVVVLLPLVLWYAYGVLGHVPLLGFQASSSFLPHLWLAPIYWLGWFFLSADALANPLFQGIVAHQVGILMLGAALLGAIFARGPLTRAVLLGGWGAYLVYGLIFNYHIHTHSYYHLPFLPIAALSLAALTDRLGSFRFFRPLPIAILGWSLCVLLCLVTIAAQAKSQEHPEYTQIVKIMEKIGDSVGHSLNTVYLTNDYGCPLAYHARIAGSYWPMQVDFYALRLRGEPIPTAEENLHGLEQKRQLKKWDKFDYFIVTNPGELDAQPDLQALLKHHPLVAKDETGSILIFSLTKTLP